MTNSFDSTYWNTRWQNGETGWDVGYPSTPIKEYVDQLVNQEMEVLIPGCGNAWEGGYLIEQGFANTWLIDIAPDAIRRLKERFSSIPAEQIMLGDFFALERQFDLIIEQTFFCALDPALRRAYAEKMHTLLKPGGRLVGVLFDDTLFTDHPPFGGSRQEYLPYFEDLFEIEVMETAYNSIAPRAGRELFISLRKSV